MSRSAEFRSRLRTSGAVVLAVLAVFFGIAMGSAPTAAAQNSIGSDVARPMVAVAWQPNGCTLSPDRAFGVSFKSACDQHDRCYHHHWAGDGFGGFVTCNNWFERDMLRACGGNNACRGQAYTYSAAVRMYGWPIFLCRACR